MKINVTVHPNSRHPRIEKDLLGQIHVYVREPPLEGRANLAVIATLADHFQVKKSAVTITSGLTSKHKLIEIG